MKSVITSMRGFFVDISGPRILSFVSLSIVLFLAAIGICGVITPKQMITAMGVLGLVNWVFIIFMGICYTNIFDRSISRTSFLRLLYILFLVLSVPCIFFCCDSAITIKTSQVWAKYDWTTFNNQWINPFLNHDNFYSIDKSLVSLVGIFLLSGVLVSVLVSFINRRIDCWNRGELYYKFSVTKYCAIIGGHDAVPSLASQLVKKHNRVIIFTNRDIPSFRREVESALQTEKEKQRIVFYYGNRGSKFDLKRLHVERKNLKSIYILGESRVHGGEEASHDTLNMTCFDYIADLRGKNKPLIDCFVFFEYQTTSIIFQKYATEHQSEALHFIPYNFYELLAQKAIGWGRCLNHTPVRLDRFDYEQEDYKNHDVDKHVHLVIIGMSRMGLALGLEAIRVCHYPNYAKSQLLYEYELNDDAIKLMKKRRTRITFIDCNMREEFDLFNSQYLRLMENVTWRYIDFLNPSNSKFHQISLNKQMVAPDVELEFINGTIQSSIVLRYMEIIKDNEHTALTIASCLPKSNQSVAVVSYLPNSIINKAEIMVFQPDSIKLVENIKINGQSKIKPFGKQSDSVDLSHIEHLEEMAKRINNVYQKSRDKVKYNTLSDFSINSMAVPNIISLENRYWALDETTRWANRYHASAIWHKWPYIEHFSNEEFEDIVGQGLSWDIRGKQIEKLCEGFMARTEHNRWCIEQWILDRPVKEEALYSYSQLEKMNSPYYVYPTNDQVMTMAIPYIIEGPPSDDEHK